MYLEPIFTSPDISQHLPVETKKYKTMERTWRRIIRNGLLEKNVSTIYIKNIVTIFTLTLDN